MKTPIRSSASQAFTIIEMVAVVTIMMILGSLMGISVLGPRTPGARYGTHLQLIQMIEEARVDAIGKAGTLAFRSEDNTVGKVYIGLAGADHPDANKRLCSYILFRDYTQDELDQLKPPVNSYYPISDWMYLPQGFYFDPDSSASLLQDPTNVISYTDGVSAEVDLHVVAFGNLGQMILPQESASAPVIVVAAGQYDSAQNVLTRSAGGTASGFYLTLNRLTGRAHVINGVPTDPTAN